MKPKTMQLDTKTITKGCKITFILGNGLDLGLGMKTKYEPHKTKTEIIKNKIVQIKVGNFIKCLNFSFF